MNTIDVIVAARTREADGIFSYELVRTDGGALPAFEAGAHIDVHIGDGQVRQYSLCNPPSETHRYLIGVLRDAASRGGSRAMHERVQPGTSLKISAPKNHFPLVPAARTLLLAGGIGITPILAMAEALAADDAAFDLHYCARSASLAAFRERLVASRFVDRVHFHFDDAPAGTLDMAALLAQPDPDARLYVCGPPGFIQHVLATARAQGWAQSRLHTEYFAGVSVDTSGDQAFDVELVSSGKVVTVPAGRTVIQVLAEHGVDIPYSCEEGVCGTCLTRVLQGVPDHRDMYLTDEEHATNDLFTPCCSRAVSARLVLDL